MGELLFDLEQTLRSKQERITPQESNFLMACKSKALRNFTGAALVSSSLVWAATRRFSRLIRFNVAGGTGAVFGLWRFGRALESSVNDILEADGTRMQKELATLIMRKYGNDPWGLRLISKHFYTEEVFDDTTVDRPILRWRYRNFYSDGVNHGEETRESDSFDDSNHNSGDNLHTDFRKEPPDSKNTGLEAKQIPTSPGIDMMADPFLGVFGYPTNIEEIEESNTLSMLPRTQSRSYRRYQRRHRKWHQEETPLNYQRA